MSVDRFIHWKEPPEWGPPTIDKLARVASDFLGREWDVEIRASHKGDRCWIDCFSRDLNTYALASETPSHARLQAQTDQERGLRFFEVFFLVEDEKIEQTSIITRHADEFTSALADQLAKIYARWWNGEVEWPS